MKKMVIFGAGKIGRSFIGQLFALSGYEVVFVDVARPIIKALNERRSYDVVIKGEREEVIKVPNVRGILATEGGQVAREISTADILASCVDNNALPHIIPLIAGGLKMRYKNDPGLALDIIIAVNMRNASEYFYRELKKEMGKDYPLKRLVGLVETSIGKMVPIMTEKEMGKDILRIFAEPYNNLILDENAFKNPIPGVDGLSPKKNMKAWVDRKLYIHNLGHAAIAYLGYLHHPGFVYVWEAFAVEELYRKTREVMMQSAAILLKEYPGDFTEKGLTRHVDNLIKRMGNKALGDTIYRIGRDIIRKLGPEDRLIGAVNMGLKHGMDIDRILYTAVCGFYFRASDENGNMYERDVIFVEEYFKKGIDYILINICGFDPEKHRKIFEKCALFSEMIEEKIKNRNT